MRPSIPASVFRSRRVLPLARLSLLAVALGLAACKGGGAEGGKGPDGKDQASKGPEAIPVEVAKASTRSISASYAGTAPLEARAESQVVAKTSGDRAAGICRHGQQVSAGQPLVRIDPRSRHPAGRAGRCGSAQAGGQLPALRPAAGAEDGQRQRRGPAALRPGERPRAAAHGEARAVLRHRERADLRRGGLAQHQAGQPRADQHADLPHRRHLPAGGHAQRARARNRDPQGRAGRCSCTVDALPGKTFDRPHRPRRRRWSTRAAAPSA